MSEIFTLRIAEFAKKAKDNAELVVRKVVLDVGKSVVMKSPVDTGRFRANWQHSTGDYSPEVFDEFDKDGGPTIANIAASLSDSTAANVHYLTNSLPYSIRLENGWSKQAPAGVVAITVVEYQQLVDQAVAGLQ